MENERPVAVTADELIAAERAERYRQQLDRPDVYPSAANWDYIIAYRMATLAPLLYRKYLMSCLTDEKIRTDYHELALEKFIPYLGAIDRADALDAVYGDVTSAPDSTLELIDRARLFSAPHLLAVLNGAGVTGSGSGEDDDEHDSVAFVVDCLGTYQPEYNAHDLPAMQALFNAVKNADYDFDREQLQALDSYGRRLSLLRKLIP